MAVMPGFHESLAAALTRAENTDAAEVETLAALLWQADRDSSVSGQGFGATYAVDPCLFAYRAQARAILTSDWLAADRAAQRRLGAEAVVAAVEAEYHGEEERLALYGPAAFGVLLDALAGLRVALDAARAAAQQVSER